MPRKLKKLTLETALEALRCAFEGVPSLKTKYGLAQMLKGGTIMDVTNAEQAKVAEEAGACSVMALERVPSDIRKQGGVARMSPVKKVKEIQATVSIPVMAKVRIGHFVEAQILEELKVDFIDESEVLTPADPFRHVAKHEFKVPFVCGATNLGEALRRIYEGAAMIRTKGEAGTGNIIEAVRHLRQIAADIAELQDMKEKKLRRRAEEYRVPVWLLELTRNLGRLPVVNFAAGGVATPADAALCMQLGCDGVFVGSGIFKSKDPSTTARAIVEAVAQFNNRSKLVEASLLMGDAMDGLEISKLETKLAERGW